MFDSNSRYHPLENKTLTTGDGRVITFKKRRFLPQGNDLPLLVEATVEGDDRLDLIAHRTIGDTEQYWRICDANNAMNPASLASEPGAKLRVPMPQTELPR